MSFLAGRLASTEGSYFLKESKQAVTRIIESQKNSAHVTEKVPKFNDAASADVLPEVLRHRLPPNIFTSSSETSVSTLSCPSKWSLKPDQKIDGARGVSIDALNPLRAYVSLPTVTFGPKRWELPSSQNTVFASTANDLRKDQHTRINPAKLKAAAAGLANIGSAFAIATTLVFGGSAVVFSFLASRFELHSTDDIRFRGKDLVQPGLEKFREQLKPMRTWAEDFNKKSRLQRVDAVKEKPLIKELSRNLGARNSH